MAAAFMLLGAVALVVGAALYDLRAAVVVAGLVLLSAGVDLARRPEAP